MFLKLTKTAFFSYSSMKVVLPISTQQTIYFIWRRVPDSFDDISYFSRKEGTGITAQVNNAVFNIVDGIGSVTFSGVVMNEGDRFQITIKNSVTDEIFYRGKALATSQEPQEYKQSNGMYRYE